jgi:hypothetical protein
MNHDYCDLCGCHWAAHRAYRPGGSCNFCRNDSDKHSQHRTDECDAHSCPRFWRTLEHRRESMGLMRTAMAEFAKGFER